ncbi:MAG: TIGR03905 family TSCPD domain-containing protein [Firmicutes bacterium]|nr:TIGR03905 family TSCPD domain-containing protein [Bacillota bacterium]
MESFEFIPKGVCSKKIIMDIENDCILSIKIIGGCPGNLLGISRLLKGKNIDDVILDLKGVKCGLKDTSCPDQIAQALIEYKSKRSA